MASIQPPVNKSKSQRKLADLTICFNKPMNIDAITYETLASDKKMAREQRNQELVEDYLRLKEKLPLAKPQQLQNAIGKLYEMSGANVRNILKKAEIA